MLLLWNAGDRVITHTSIMLARASGCARIGCCVVPARHVGFGSRSVARPLRTLPGADESRYWHAVLAVDPNNANIVYTNGDHSVYVSTNYGVTWSPSGMYQGYQRIRLIRDTENAQLFIAHDVELFKAAKHAPEFYD